MPSRAARWISAIALRSNVADSRRPGCQPPATGSPASPLPPPPYISIAPEVLDMEVVELTSRPIAAELGCLDVVQLGALEQLREVLEVLCTHLLLDAVGAELGDRSANVQTRLIQRVAQRLAGVAAYDQRALLRHEGAHVADRPAHDDLGSLQRDPAARRGVAVDDE